LPGLVLDADTGLLSGIPGLEDFNANSYYYSNIKVEDSASPVPNVASIYRLYMRIELPAIDTCVDITSLTEFIDDWRNGFIPIAELMNAIVAWKQGCE